MIKYYLSKVFKLGWQDLNLRMAESKSAALPLGDTPRFGQEGIRTPDTMVRNHVL